MEPHDKELIDRLVPEDDELKQLVDEHRDFERQLDEFTKRPYLTTEEEMERKRLQKMKLAGKDKIATKLTEYRKKKT